MTEDLSVKRCVVCEGGVAPLTTEEANHLLKNIDQWVLNDATSAITKRYEFKGFMRTMMFVNAVAWMAQNQGHHPDMQVGYGYCVITFSTHAINGLSENDFICAAKVDQLLSDA